MKETAAPAQMIYSDSRSPALNDRRPGYRSSAMSLSCVAVSNDRARSQTTVRLAVAGVMRQHAGDGQGGSSGDGGGDEVMHARCILGGGFNPPR